MAYAMVCYIGLFGVFGLLDLMDGDVLMFCYLCAFNLLFQIFNFAIIFVNLLLLFNINYNIKFIYH